MGELLYQATHQGKLDIGNKKLDCAVLDNDARTRVISLGAVFKAFGRSKRGRPKDEIRVPNMPSFVDAKNLQPFINKDLRTVLKPVKYLSSTGREVTGFDAEILPLLCDLYLEARAKGALTKQQEPLAMVAEILVRSFAKVGIIALIDEATGYQEVRDRDELNRILEAYIAKELLPWAKRFPDEFYKQLFRLRGWQYSPISVKRPGYVGTLTNKLIYEKLPPGVLEELRKKNPRTPKGHRKHRHHQYLTENIGNPHLEKHLASVTTLMRAASNWSIFERLFKRAFPDGPQQIEMSFMEDEE